MIFIYVPERLHGQGARLQFVQAVLDWLKIVQKNLKISQKYIGSFV